MFVLDFFCFYKNKHFFPCQASRDMWKFNFILKKIVPIPNPSGFKVERENSSLLVLSKKAKTYFY